VVHEDYEGPSQMGEDALNHYHQSRLSPRKVVERHPKLNLGSISNHQLFKKIKLMERYKFNHLINTLILFLKYGLKLRPF
jgi:hypothetical protein